MKRLKKELLVQLVLDALFLSLRFGGALWDDISAQIILYLLRNVPRFLTGPPLWSGGRKVLFAKKAGVAHKPVLGVGVPKLELRVRREGFLKNTCLAFLCAF
jgi:hypothetical protein